MKKWAVLAGFCTVISACTTTKSVTLPDGSQGFVLQCNGTLNSMASCQIDAGKACPSGYVIIDGDERRGAASVPNQNGGYSTLATATRSLMIRCRPGAQ